jgi:hypothetical protein
MTWPRHQLTGRKMLTGQASGPVPTPAAYGGQGTVTMTERPPRAVREFPIGFESSAGVAGGATASISVLPQVVYRGERLALTATIATQFDIQDIKVGKDSQLAVSGQLPGECFSNVSIGVRMVLDTAEPGVQIVLNVINTTSATTATFKAVLYGTVVD